MASPEGRHREEPLIDLEGLAEGGPGQDLKLEMIPHSMGPYHSVVLDHLRSPQIHVYKDGYIF